ncbi:MAG: acetyl-CoA acetyltransferase [Actinobacteria bacterium RBG_16_64_13]|nr:MAG: acetyl-CoA acetyltransferase [Actinobacteria bacterium RBG_16_64_13]
MAHDTVILSACRTATGRFLGSLSEVPAVQMGGIVIADAVKRAGLEPPDVQEVIFGNVLQAGQGQNPGRLALHAAGLPDEIPAVTVNKLCGSGMKAVHFAAQTIAMGDAEVLVAGGMENMSLAPYLLAKVRTGYRMGDGVLEDHLLRDGLTCAVNNYHMGMTAENVAARYGVTREDQDTYALESQRRACAAVANGLFKDEITPVPVPKKKGGSVLFDTDEHPRPETTPEELAKLKPAFKADGTVTAGNASGVNDAAAALVLTSRGFAARRGLKPLARIVGCASAALDPAYMGLGPYHATLRVLEKTGMSLDQMDVVEANEAFAAQALAVARLLDLDMTKTNLCGGAIALGHPIGASGARILTTLLYALRRTGGRYGLAAMCIGGGQGIATIIEAQ